MSRRSRRSRAAADALEASGSVRSPSARLPSRQPASAQAPPSAQPPSTQPPSARNVSWTDEAGRHWTRRGGAVTTSRLRQLLARPEVRVVHIAQWEVHDVPLVGRAALRQRIEPYLKEAVRAAGDHTEFVVGEFRDENGGRLLVIEEYC